MREARIWAAHAAARYRTLTDELARVLEYMDFRNFIAVITKAREAKTGPGFALLLHFERVMSGIKNSKFIIKKPGAVLNPASFQDA